METPEFFQGGYYNQFTAEKRVCETKNGENFIIEDLLDYPNDDNNVMVTDEAMFDNINKNNMKAGSGGTSTDSSTVTVLDTSCNSSLSGSTKNHHVTLGADIAACRNLPEGHFGSELCVPYDDLAELEWLSNFVEESFSSEDLQKMQLISGVKARTETSTGGHYPNFHHNEADQTIIPTPTFLPEIPVPAKARSKRSRAAPCNWTSRLLVLSSPQQKVITPNASQFVTTTTATNTATIVTPPTMSVSSSSESDLTTGSGKKIIKHTSKRKENSDSGGEERRCLHCMTDKTPQWRTGPMGPKTLCNACGVRYKSGRLVPEYRPASSPTFMLTKHSNSHRKVLEIRRQKEVQRAQHQQQELLQHGMMFDLSNGDDYLIHQHIGPDFRQLL